MDSKKIQKAKELLKDWEGLCESKNEFVADRSYIELMELLEECGLEFCCHNVAFLGSKIYEKYKIEGVEKLITFKEYKQLKKIFPNKIF